jgi:S1-C subfamily serine protease
VPGRFLIASRSLEGFRLVEIDHVPLVKSFSRIYELIKHRCGPEIADLFAEPVISRENGATPTRIDWYTSVPGAPQPFSRLDVISSVDLRQRLQTRLAALRALTFEPHFGPLVAGMLNIASPEAVLSVGGEPVLVDWGLLPQTALTDDRSRRLHFTATLAQFAPAIPLPPLTREEWSERFEWEPNKTDISATAAAPSRVLPTRLAPGGTRSAYRAPVTACALAFAILLVLLIPGVLIYPGYDFDRERPTVSVVNDALRERQTQLQAALEADCGELPQKILRLIPPSPREVKVRVPGGTARPIAGADAPVIYGPGDPRLPASPQARFPSPLPVTTLNLAERIERGVVIVVAGTKTGTAFFVTPDTLVTNRHVIEGERSIAIAGGSVGIIPAQVVNVRTQMKLDFALLHVAPQAEVLPFSLSMQIQPLSPVAAAGFPGLYLETDPVFSSLKRGDFSVTKRLLPVLTTGVVNHLQHYDEDEITLVLHGADIAPGNSGGPLVDYCGRVVGVNTFGRVDQSLPVTARYALGADGLQRFLAAASVFVSTESTACEPQLVTMFAPEATASPEPKSGTAAPAPSHPPAGIETVPSSRPAGAPR